MLLEPQNSDANPTRNRVLILCTGNSARSQMAGGSVCGAADRNCPSFSGNAAKRIHIGFIDPAAATGSEEQILDTFRHVRDQIRAKFLDFYNNEITK